MNLVMQGLTWEACLVFLDDIIVLSSTFEQHLERLEAVFQRLRWANLKLKPSKCKLFQLKVKFLGSVVSEKGIEPDPDKLTAISKWPVPENLTEVRAFVGLASYYRRHVEGFSDIAKPLSELTKKNQPFLWGPEQQSAFDKLKYCLTHYPVLAPPIPGGKYIIDTDASDFAMGAVLQQEQHGIIRVIAYASKTFDAAERMYCTTRKELAAVTHALKEFRHYVVGGVPFLLRTDHGALTSLFKTPEPIQQQARYLNFLADYNFEIQHRAGFQHGNSDGLSRRPCGSEKCTRQDCETNRNQTRNVVQTKPVHQKMGRPLRSGNAYQKGDKASKPTEGNQGNMESVPVPNRLDMKILDLSWNLIREAQETDVTLRKLFELLRDPDPPTNVNEFGIWESCICGINERAWKSSMVSYTGIMRRLKDSSCITRFWFLHPYRKNFCIGSMGIQLRDTSEYRRLPTNCNDTLIGRGGERTRNFLSDAATNVVGIARDPHVLKDL